MFKLDRVAGASILFALFFIGACVSAYLDSSLRAQLYTFIFMGLGALYSIVLILIDPKPKQAEPTDSPVVPDPRGSLSQPTNQPTEGV